ncbi:hypothetical protein CORC01_04654 [Colletotrichum orchidophilum]|uniref:Uncharacterized protein n=1 Tax=Colletotrichum orchidophilum TaxID=1209926 RepID=A0A1G4BF82_9PEZI|nr:uncharacterized protein CORC01_04654 [Colletotrichum orchidophilum]OHF00008.1 hypothetical protein CORC01_04654 [Colletotrichum orchidophilum]
MAKPFNNVEGRRVPPDSNENASDFDQQDSVPTSPVSIAPDAVAVVSRKYQSHASFPREDESDYDYDGNYDTPNQTEDKARVQSGLSDEEHRRGLNLGIEFGGEATYYGNYAGHGVNQYNGPKIEDDIDLLNRLVEPQSASTPTRTTGNPFDSPRTVYMGSIKTGSGIQLNGLHATYSGTLMGIPRVSAHYSGCVLAAEYDNSGKPTRQSQHNGPYLRKLQRGDGGSSQGNGMHGKN